MRSAERLPDLLPTVTAATDAGPDAADPWCDDFSTFDAAAYHLDSECGRWDPRAQHFLLTPNRLQCRSRLFLKEPLLAETFTVTARIFIRNASGADGLTIALADRVDYPYAGTVCAPNRGGHLDFDGADGFAIEFDTWFNAEWDPTPKSHIAIVKDGVRTHAAWAPFQAAGSWHHVSVKVEGSTVEVAVDDARLLHFRDADFSVRPLFLGFTSGTCAVSNEHAVDDVCVTPPP